ncbi:MAG TPA: ethanolamine utilization protein EutH [Kineosporiaceae bacterium]|nr:ethanolamine utilization protein EutH [Kineosporiaceae bacterium]
MSLPLTSTVGSILPGRRRTLAFASIAVLLAAADTYVVVLALPDMMLGVGLGIDELQRATPIISAFLLGYVVTLPLIGRLADLRGCRAALIGCLLIFGLGCLITAAATDLGTLVTGRALQGVGGGGLVPATLALVAETWPVERRGLPLGVVGAVQETGATLGPLFGAGVLAVSGWRAIFWANLAGAAVLWLGLKLTPAGRTGGEDSPPTPGLGSDPTAVNPPARHSIPVRSRLGWAIGGLGVLALTLFLLAPQSLVTGITTGRAWIPLVEGHHWSAPLAVLALALAGLGLVLGLAGAALGDLVTQVDVVGALLLAGTLAGLVLAFATADPQISVVSAHAPLLLFGSALGAVGFVVRQRTTRMPLIPVGTLRQRAAWAALVVNLLIGAALVAALVDVPVFARSTSQHDQLGAAMVLVRFLVAVPVGALIGGWVIRRLPVNLVSAAGLLLAAVGLAAMTRWSDDTLVGLGGTAELVVAGLGFGLAIAPVNAALLAATRAEVHGIASALVVVARMIGMLAGLSILTAVGLRVFYREQQRIGTVIDVCPASPTNCPAYTEATHAALLTELHTIFGSAAACTAVAAVLCLILLKPPPTGAVPTLPLGVR